MGGGESQNCQDFKSTLKDEAKFKDYKSHECTTERNIISRELRRRYS
jgi:hypothetical protein